MDRDLYGFLGGIAASGARYKIEIVVEDGQFVARAYNAGGSSAWGAGALVAADRDATLVKRKAMAKFAPKTVPGRDRAYTRPLVGGPDAGAFPKGLDELPEHPLCWKVGRSLALLPAELRHRAILVDGQSPDDGATTPPSAMATAAGSDGHPPRGQVVMLCETIADAHTLDRLIGQPTWLMTEKMEGDRAQLHRDEDAVVYLTNRSGELVNCPPHIAAAMEQLPAGTSLDGELITVDELGRAQLYVGGAATIQLFVAFDLLAHPRMLDGMATPQAQRLELLADLLAGFSVPLSTDGPAIRCVPFAITEAGKHMLLQEIRSREGEGVVMRNADSPYEGRRSASWQRFRDREATMDAVVLGYRTGTGTLADQVGAVQVGLYDEGTGHLHAIGWVGSGWSREQRAALTTLRDSAVTGYVVEVKAFGLTFADQVIRPSGVHIRPVGDKRPTECTFINEAGRPYGAMR